MNYVTDTHALLWWFVDSPRISPSAARIFERCEEGEDGILVPSIVIAEALSIFDKKRVHFDFRRLLRKITESENYRIVPLDLPVLSKMIGLDDVPELHDKIIVATARHLELTLITKDKTLRALSHLKTIW
jgi:PIN domain nuclease of toxin-antitoxin system